MNIQIMATLWPDMPHYEYFARHPSMAGIRLNTAMADVETLPQLMNLAVEKRQGTPLYFDVKGRQLRITKVYDNKENLEIDLNHPIEVETPTVVLFKAGADRALLRKAEGNHLIFEGGPQFSLLPGESLNIRSKTLKILGNLFTEQQLKFLTIAKRAGIKHYMLSYATHADELAELRSIVGDRAELVAKIENPKGIEFAQTYILKKNESFLTARGDLYVEVEKPHQILDASKKILARDPNAILGSRILLSVTEKNVPECSDINEVAWLLEIGYKRFMFCDGLCLKKDALERAVNALAAIARDYQ